MIIVVSRKPLSLLVIGKKGVGWLTLAHSIYPLLRRGCTVFSYPLLIIDLAMLSNLVDFFRKFEYIYIYISLVIYVNSAPYRASLSSHVFRPFSPHPSHPSVSNPLNPIGRRFRRRRLQEYVVLSIRLFALFGFSVLPSSRILSPILWHQIFRAPFHKA